MKNVPFFGTSRTHERKNVTLYNSKEAPDVEEVVQAQGFKGLTKMIIAF